MATLPVYFSDYFYITLDDLAKHGAFDVSLDSDLPLFVDPFLLFNSEKEQYQELHDQIIRYLRFLRDRSKKENLSDAELRYYYCFKEVKENWLGFCFMGNEGRALGMDFARSLHGSLNRLFSDFGEEQVTRGSHIEKVSLIKGHVGRDSISDFTTNLIKNWLLEYTQSFAQEKIAKHLRRDIPVTRAHFNYMTSAWETKVFDLPWFAEKEQFVLLTPTDILTKDEAWINHGDFLHNFHEVPEAISDPELKMLVNQYFYSMLSMARPTKEDRLRAAERTISEYPEVIDYYIKLKEDTGDEAVADSRRRVEEADATFRITVSRLAGDMRDRTVFYRLPVDSYRECLDRAKAFKHYVENQDGYKLLSNVRRGTASEKDVQLAFGLVWYGSVFDVNREVDNGRGPVDFKVSYGDSDKSLVEMKLASNSQLKRNLEKQVDIYEQANRTSTSVKIVVFFTQQEEERVKRITKELGINEAEWLVLVDSRTDNKPSGSKA